MIAGTHVIIYAEDAEAARAFVRDTLGFDGIDAGGGWLTFSLPPAELAFHPGESGQHELFFMCRDIEKTVEELKRKGVEFVAAISDEGWGLLTWLEIPGGGKVGLYEPRHPSPLAEFTHAS